MCLKDLLYTDMCSVNSSVETVISEKPARVPVDPILDCHRSGLLNAKLDCDLIIKLGIQLISNDLRERIAVFVLLI